MKLVLKEETDIAEASGGCTGVAGLEAPGRPILGIH